MPAQRDSAVDIDALADGNAASTQSSIEPLYRVVLDSLTEEVAIVDRHGKVIDCNRAWLTGDTGPALLGRRIVTGGSYLDAVRQAAVRYPEIAALRDAVERVLAGRAASFQHEHTCSRNGRERWWLIRLGRLQRPDGGLVVIHDDISERRRAERERDSHRAELSRAGSAAVLGQLSGALAHELNQPLTAILANAQVGIDTAVRSGADAELHAILHDIEHDTKRAGELIKRVRDLLKRREADFEPIELNRVVDDVLSLSHSDVLLRGIRVSSSLDPKLPPLHGDPIQLQQLLLNLVMNACEAMCEVERGNRNLHIATAARANGWIRLTVSDSGSGFPSVEPNRALQPFYTTKEKGLGLGLTICSSIVQAHGGTIRLGKRRRGGARVTVDFPPLTSAAAGKP